jgi:starch synthase
VREGENGFVFDQADGAAMQVAVERALDAYASREAAWRTMQKRAMNTDFSWADPAREYLQVYRGGR